MLVANNSPTDGFVRTLLLCRINLLCCMDFRNENSCKINKAIVERKKKLLFLAPR